MLQANLAVPWSWCIFTLKTEYDYIPRCPSSLDSCILFSLSPQKAFSPLFRGRREIICSAILLLQPQHVLLHLIGNQHEAGFTFKLERPIFTKSPLAHSKTDNKYLWSKTNNVSSTDLINKIIANIDFSNKVCSTQIFYSKWLWIKGPILCPFFRSSFFISDSSGSSVVR